MVVLRRILPPKKQNELELMHSETYEIYAPQRGMDRKISCITAALYHLRRFSSQARLSSNRTQLHFPQGRVMDASILHNVSIL